MDAAGNAYAVWDDQRNGHDDIYFSYRPAGGSWGTNVRVNDDPGTANQYSPGGIGVDPSGNAYAVWHDYRNGDADIYFSYRPAGGGWGPNIRVNDDVGTDSQTLPAIAVDGGGNAYAVWQDWRNTSMHNCDIYSSYRPAGGSWGTNVKVNDDPGPDRHVSAAIGVDAAGNAYAVWEDWRNGTYVPPTTYFNSDIYFSYRPGEGVAPTPTPTFTPTPTPTFTPTPTPTPPVYEYEIYLPIIMKNY